MAPNKKAKRDMLKGPPRGFTDDTSECAGPCLVILKTMLSSSTFTHARTPLRAGKNLVDMSNGHTARGHVPAVVLIYSLPTKYVFTLLPASSTRTPRFGRDADVWEDGYYHCKIINHRLKGDAYEYLVKWSGTNKKGDPWPTEWKTGADVTPDLKETYMSQAAPGVAPHFIILDATLVYKSVRRTVAHALMFGAPGLQGFGGRHRPRVHSIILGSCGLEAVALGMLEVARKHGGPAIPLDHGNRRDPDCWWQLIISELPRVATFCEFEHFLEGAKAKGNVRTTGTAKHSGDMMAVGNPIILTVKRLWHTPGLVTTTLEFATVHFNGRTGQPTYPHMSKGLLKRQGQREELITHVRDSLGPKHPLRKAGWCAFPANVSALAREYACPSK